MNEYTTHIDDSTSVRRWLYVLHKLGYTSYGPFIAGLPNNDVVYRFYNEVSGKLITHFKQQQRMTAEEYWKYQTELEKRCNFHDVTSNDINEIRTILHELFPRDRRENDRKLEHELGHAKDLLNFAKRHGLTLTPIFFGISFSKANDEGIYYYPFMTASNLQKQLCTRKLIIAYSDFMLRKSKEDLSPGDILHHGKTLPKSHLYSARKAR